MWPFTSAPTPSDASTSTLPPTTSAAPPPGHPPVPASAGDKCPVDEQTRLKWLATQAQSPSPLNPSSTSPRSPQPHSLRGTLPTDRETSTIPRYSTSILPTLSPGSDPSSYSTPAPPVPQPNTSTSPHAGSASDEPGATNWVYPSEAQFYAAMERKNHNPNPEDMKTIVPIHNAVNEKAWKAVLEWEKGSGGEECGGVRLVTFLGTPGKWSPKSLVNRWLFG